MVEADDFFSALAAFALNTDQLFRVDVVAVVRRVLAGVDASVRPEQLSLTDPMALVNGTSSIIHFQFETDIFPGLIITEENPGLYATAYGLLGDFVRAAGL